MIRPFVKWVGGKANMADALVERITPHLRRNYIEPFLGGGAVALALAEKHPRRTFLLSDFNATLMTTWRAAIDGPQVVSDRLRKLIAAGVESEHYYAARQRFNLRSGTTAVLGRFDRAAFFLYLNALGYNGLYRENAKGEYNVPKGRRPSTYFPTSEHLREVSDLFAGRAKIGNGDAVEAIAMAEPHAGDVIYADPPYDGTFAAYTADGFGTDKQIELAGALQRAHTAGATIITTNADTPHVRELYSWATFEDTNERRSVSQDGTKRQKAACVIITAIGAS